MSNEYIIKKAREVYKEGNLVPFIGAGLSIPFNIPDWGGLIEDYALSLVVDKFSGFHDLIRMELSDFEYWEALRAIKRYAKRTDQDIQEYVCESINKKINLNIEEEKHNYADLAKMNFNIYITTNYDHILGHFLKTNYNSINLKDLGSSTQNMFRNGQKRTFHLHGNISQEDSIVITEEQYKELYDNKKYDALFSLFTGTKSFLFLGFSFNDIFIQKIIQDHNEYFRSKHYIVLHDPKPEQIDWLKMNFNIETIPYKVENSSSHAIEIRNILRLISLDDDQEFEEEVLAYEVMEYLLEKLPDSKEKEALEESFFCKKLRLENIEDNLVDYSKNCFFTAEQYIRWLSKSKFLRKNDIIRHMLDLCYLKYQDLFIRVFNEYKDSEMFIKIVHEVLASLDYSRVEKIISKDYMPSEINKQGFVHILADENLEDKEIWWGEKRFE